MSGARAWSPRAVDLAAGLLEHQREYIVECDALLDAFGFVVEPNALGREVMDLVRWEAQQQQDTVEGR